ncbi:MAG: hypothetical protein U0175_21900 [Caldilineaceae bacterium]
MKARLTAPLTILAILGLLFLLPPERTLGDVIKLVLLHGALVRVGLIAFALAGALGAICLFTTQPHWLRWCQATQVTALLFWLGNVISSSIATKWAWGEWIAWSEPRVWATIHITWMALACLLLTRWVNQRSFTALANLAVAGISWGLIKGATLVRHPFDPIGSSNVWLYQALYGAMVILLLVAGWQFARWLQYSHWLIADQQT